MEVDWPIVVAGLAAVVGPAATAAVAIYGQRKAAEREEQRDAAELERMGKRHEFEGDLQREEWKREDQKANDDRDRESAAGDSAAKYQRLTNCRKLLALIIRLALPRGKEATSPGRWQEHLTPYMDSVELDYPIDVRLSFRRLYDEAIDRRREEEVVVGGPILDKELRVRVASCQRAFRRLMRDLGEPSAEHWLDDELKPLTSEELGQVEDE